MPPPWDTLNPNNPTDEDIIFVLILFLIGLIISAIISYLHKNGMLYAEMKDLFKIKRKNKQKKT